jgi:PDZ domain/Aspartyl protease
MLTRPGFWISCAMGAVFALALPALAADEAAAADPEAILARIKAETGGERWDRIRSRHVVGKLAAGGLNGTAEQWDDIVTGRTYGTFKLGPLSGAQGYDGKVLWTQDESGQSRAETTQDAIEGTISGAYRTSMAFWYPERRAGTVEYVARRSMNGHDDDVLRMSPAGGRPFEIWVNTQTSLIEQLTEREASETRTETYGDYREVDGVHVPFTLRFSHGEPKYDQVLTVESVDFGVPLDEARFAQPTRPAADYTFAIGKARVEIPFKVYNGHIYLPVKIDGKGPFLMLFDSGGANILQPSVAKQLGLKVEGALGGSGVGESKQDVGMTKVGRIELGGIVVRDQVFATIDLQDFASRVEGLDHVAGLVGYELFKRFPVTIDYQRSRAIFYNPETFEYAGKGVRVPFRFKGHIPQVEGSVDGIAGAFDIDTGSRASIDLTGPFVDKNGLAEKYAAKYRVVSGAGVGGRVYSSLARAGALTLGDVAVVKPVTYLSQQKQGAFADVYLAGNVGYGVLKQFNITFDYSRQQLFFEKNADYGRPDVADRSGMWLERTKRGFEVVDVVAGGAAEEAGLKAGDVIVAIDGKPTSAWLLADARTHLKAAEGTRVRVSIERTKRELELKLRDLV